MNSYVHETGKCLFDRENTEYVEIISDRKVAADLVFHAGLLLRDISYIPIDKQAGISNHIH